MGGNFMEILVKRLNRICVFFIFFVLFVGCQEHKKDNKQTDCKNLSISRKTDNKAVRKKSEPLNKKENIFSYKGIDYRVISSHIKKKKGWSLDLNIEAIPTDGGLSTKKHEKQIFNDASVPSRADLNKGINSKKIQKNLYPTPSDQFFVVGKKHKSNSDENNDVTFRINLEKLDEQLDMRRFSPRLTSIWIDVVDGGEPEIQLKHSEESFVKYKEYANTKIGNHNITIKPFDPTRATERTIYDDPWDPYIGTFEAGDVTVTIKRNELLVNSQHYGNLKDNDSILIEYRTVYVNGIERKGRQLSREAILQYSPVKESKEEIGGYYVHMRPGSASIAKLTYKQKHILIMGKKRIEITNKLLFVNRLPYGTINKGDLIEIYFDDVIIAGKKRTPQKKN